MKFTKIMTAAITLSLLVSQPINVMAKPLHSVKCPTPATIRQMATLIDTGALISGNQYVAKTKQSVFRESGLYWMIGVLYVTANSEQEAIAQGKTITAEATTSLSEIAEEWAGMIFCKYLPQNRESPLIMAFGDTAPSNAGPHALTSMKLK